MQQPPPGVYSNELNAFPNAVVEVATAVPVFIGYTATANYRGEDLANKPRRVTSLQEYETCFGQGAVPVFDLKTPDEVTPAQRAKLAVQPVALQINDVSTFGPSAGPLKNYVLVPDDGCTIYYLYNSVRLFYQNGGATCYIVSIGAYEGGVSGNAADNGSQPGGKPQQDHFVKALDALVSEPEPTLLVCPDALCLREEEYYGVAQKMLQHCDETQRRVAVLDVYQGAVTNPLALNGDDTPISRFRTGVANSYLQYGAGYFPWVYATVVSETETSFQNMSQGVLRSLGDAATEALQRATADAAATNGLEQANDQQTQRAVAAYAQLVQEARRMHAPSKAGVAQEGPEAERPVAAQHRTAAEAQREVVRLHNALLASNPDYRRVAETITRYRNTLPVAAAMAGVYTAVDINRGVWKAPANVGLSGLSGVTVNLSDNDQARLHVDAVSGKSVNAIRPFPGQGVLVWGARTLAGNSQDGRFVNVRRTTIMIEQSVKLAVRAYVFEPNDANTWVTVQGMISNFLLNLWKQGALAGSKPGDAYSVAVGLGTTMTAQDILDGYLNVFVKVALSQPAEFTVLSFQQQMQQS